MGTFTMVAPILLLAFVGVVSASFPCSSLTTCGECTSFAQGCGWCPGTQKCVSGSIDGPASSSDCPDYKADSLLATWDYSYCSTAACSEHMACSTCAAHPFCQWDGKDCSKRVAGSGGVQNSNDCK